MANRRRTAGHRQARDPQHRPAAVGRPGAADPRCRHDRRRGRPDRRGRPGQRPRHRAAPTSSSMPRARAWRPGLIDSHVHPVFGDWTPRQSQLGWIDSFLHGGVTTMISAGEVHLPGRPKDVVGVKALAITAQRAFDRFRPGGVKVHAGAPVLETGHGRERLPRTGRGRRHAAGRGRARRRQGRATSAADGRLGAQVRHPEHDPHRRPVDPGSGPDRHGRRAGGRRRRHRPHQRRPHRAARRQIRCLCEQLHARDRAGPQRQRAAGAARAAHRDRAGPARARHPRHRRAGRLRRAAARHPADDRHAGSLGEVPAETRSASPPATPRACAASTAA